MSHTHGKHPLDFFRLKKRFSNVHFHNSIQSFALSLVSVFIPIYLLELGFDVNSVLLYFIIFYSVFALFSFLTFLIPSVGFKKIIMLRPIFLVVRLVWLYSLEFFPNSLFYLAIFRGACAAFYWVAFHYFLSDNITEVNAEDSVGLLFAVPNVLKTISPLIGALIINIFSFEVLFVSAGLLFVVSVIPLLDLKEERFLFAVDFKRFFRKKIWKYLFGIIGDGINYAVVYILLPLFIYLSFSQTMDVGIFSTLLGLAGFITPLLVANIVKGDNSKFIKLGSFVQGVLFFLVFFLDSSLSFFIFGFVMGVVSNLWTIPFYSKMYKYSHSTNTLMFFMIREFLLNIGRILVIFLMWFFDDFSIAFISEIISKFFFFLF